METFFLPMALVLVAIIAITIWFRSIYGAVFWENFLAQFLATVIGVVFSIMFTWALWRLQQKRENSFKREQLINDLIAEATVNAQRISALDKVMESILTKRPNEISWADSLIKSMRDNRYRLRTAAMKNILKPEHLVLISDIELADYLEWLLPRSEIYNVTLLEALNRFWYDGYKRKDVTASVSDLNESIFPIIFSLSNAFDIIVAKKKSYRQT